MPNPAPKKSELTSSRPSDWSSYLSKGAVATDDFDDLLALIDDLPVQERYFFDEEDPGPCALT